MPSSDSKNGVRSGMGADRWRNDHTGPVAPSYTYGDLLRRRGSLLAFVRHDSGGHDDAAVAAAAEPDSGAADSGDTGSDEQLNDPKAQLRSVLGAERSDGELTQLLERCGWDVQRAVAAHFNDVPAASCTALPRNNAEARVGGVEAVRAGKKRLAQSEGRHQQKGKQRSVVTMWGRRL